MTLKTMLSVSLVLACGFMVAGCEDPATDQTAPKTNCVIEAAKAMPQTLSNGMTKTGVCTNCKCAIYKCAKGKEIYVCPETGVAKTKLADGTFAPWKCKKSGKARIVCPKTGKVTNAPE